MDMKFISVLFFTMFIVNSRGSALVPYQIYNCPPLLPFKIKLQAILLDLDGKSDEDLKTCMIKNLLCDQSLILISNSNNTRIPVLRKYKTTESPNVVIMTKTIHPDVLHFSTVKRVLKSHRSLVYISIMNSTIFNCKDGELDANELLSLETFMNQLWHKYKIMQVAVLFPLACKEKVAVYSEKTNKSKVLYDRTIQLIDRDNTKLLYATVGQTGQILTEGYPLKADIFFRYPTAITRCENLHYYTKMNLNLTKGFCGLDASVMYIIVKHFKFKLFYPESDVCNKYGYATSNNTIVGSLGCVVRQELDISFNSRFMRIYSTDDIYFGHYITTDSLSFMIKRADVIPIWLYPISIRANKLWTLIITIIIVTGLIMWAMETVNSRMAGRKRRKMYYYMKDVFTSIVLGFTSVKNKNLYILRGTCLFSSIVFVAALQGYISHVFTSLLRYDLIKTLDDLYRSENRLFISPSMREIIQYIENPQNENQHKFLKQAGTVPLNYRLNFLFKHPRSALLGRKQDATIEILSEYADENKSPLINIIEESLCTFYLSYIARKGFPFYEELQRLLQRIGEAGLPLIYHRWTCNMLRVPQSLPKFHNEARPFEKIKLEDQRVAFGVLAFGYIVSLTVFIIEIVKGRRQHNTSRLSRVRYLERRYIQFSH